MANRVQKFEFYILVKSQRFSVIPVSFWGAHKVGSLGYNRRRIF